MAYELSYYFDIELNKRGSLYLKMLRHNSGLPSSLAVFLQRFRLEQWPSDLVRHDAQAGTSKIEAANQFNDISEMDGGYMIKPWWLI